MTLPRQPAELGAVRTRTWTARSASALAVLTAQLLVLVATMVVLGAVPAGAHTVGGVDVTNYRTRITSVDPALPGLSIRPVEQGDRLALTNTGGRDVVVEGYDGEPYLRVGPRGVFENVRSPATYLNRDRLDPAPPPPRADPSAPPRWRKVSDGRTARWHDHRAHWMGRDDPPMVQRAPGEDHLVQRFTIVVRAGDETVRVRGDVRWIAGPSPWPWLAVAGAIVAGTVVAGRRRGAPRALAAILGLTLVATAAHGVGAFTAGTNALVERTGEALPALGALALGIVALGRLLRRGLGAAAPLLVFAGLLLAIAVGIADFAALSKSQLPTDLPALVDRATVAVVLGGGFGVTAGAALHVADRPGEPKNESHSMIKG